MKFNQNIWFVLAAIPLGLLVGGGFFTVKESNALSYLSDSPKACINCHVMNDNYISWTKSSHSSVATCNDCHVPQDNFASKYLFKAVDGMKHATMFTLRMEKQVPKMGQMGHKAVQNNCVRCHGGLFSKGGVHSNMPIHLDQNSKKKKMVCWSCHQTVPHGDVKGLTSSKDGLIDKEKDEFVSDWIKLNKQHGGKDI